MKLIPLPITDDMLKNPSGPILPKCPHCKKELKNLIVLQHGDWERHIIYLCEHCHSILSIGNDTGAGF